MRALPPHQAVRFMEMVAKGVQPPMHIQEKKAEIEAATRLADFRHQNGITSEEEMVEDAQRIVRMKLELDDLYADWVEEVTADAPLV